jgi:hypothetical protein
MNEVIDVNCISGCMVDVSGLESSMTQIISDTAALQTQLYVMQTYMSTTIPLLVYCATLFTALIAILTFMYLNTLRGNK